MTNESPPARGSDGARDANPASTVATPAASPAASLAASTAGICGRPSSFDLDEAMPDAAAGASPGSPPAAPAGNADGPTVHDDGTASHTRPAAAAAGARTDLGPPRCGVSPDIAASRAALWEEVGKGALAARACISAGLAEHERLENPLECIQDLAGQYENDGTPELSVDSTPYRHIALLIPIRGTVMDALCEPRTKGPVSKAIHVIAKLFPEARTAVVRKDRGSEAVMLGFDDVAALRRVRMYAWEQGCDPAYPGSRGPHRILMAEKLDSLRITGVMATSERGAIAAVRRKLQQLHTADGRCPHHSRIGATERPPGRWMVFVDAYGDENARAIYDRLHGKALTSPDYDGESRCLVRVFGNGPLARCQVCSGIGHSSGSCHTPSLYLQCASNGLTPALCNDMQEHLGAAEVFPGANPARLGVREFGFAVFPEGFTARILSMAVAMYQCGILSHVPRIVKGGGARACGDCGMLDEDEEQHGRRGAHSNRDSPMCPLHRHDNTSGRRPRSQQDDDQGGAGISQFHRPNARQAPSSAGSTLTQAADPAPAQPGTTPTSAATAVSGSASGPSARPLHQASSMER
jgi:hypothetical protein